MGATSGDGEAWAGGTAPAKGATQLTQHPRLGELETLYRTRYSHFVSHFRKAGLPLSVAQELTHETFVAGLAALPQFKGDSQLFTWVWRIAINQLNAYFRAAARREDCVGSAEDVHAICPPGLTDSLEATLIDKQQAALVQAAFARFARDHPERAMVVSMAMQEGATGEVLATWLGRSPGATREYLSQSRKVLQTYLEAQREK